MRAALLRRAAAEYFIDGYMASEIRRTVENTPEQLRVDALEKMRPRHTVPEGCFAWISHLVWLERMLEIAPIALAADEAEGLAIFKQERKRFQAEHPPCPHCGMPNEPEAFTCRECFGTIKKG